MEPRSLTSDAESKALRELATGKKEKPAVEFLRKERAEGATFEPPKRSKLVKRGLLSTGRQDNDARRTVVQHYAVDEFGELGGRKKGAAKVAFDNGHQLGKWSKRPGDPYGRQDSHCVDCNAIVTVAVEEPKPYNLPFVYGDALTKKCTVGK